MLSSSRLMTLSTAVFLAVTVTTALNGLIATDSLGPA